MHISAIIHIIGLLLVAVAASMLLPIFWALYYGGSDFGPLLFSALLIFSLGGTAWYCTPKEEDLSIRDGMLVAVFGWIVISALSALPFVLHGSIPSFTNAFFEMMSGYTTTGGSILEDIEALPQGLLLLRSQTHLLGGMGFLTLIIMFLPKGTGGQRLFRAEGSPGLAITKEKFAARTKDTLVTLWLIYLLLNCANILLLLLGGMDLFDALCTAFGSVSTAGYSPKNSSIGAYNSAYIEGVTILFMFIGGTSFFLLYLLFHGDFKALLNNTEFKWYVLLLGFFCGMVALILWQQQTYSSLMQSIRYSTFQVLSLLTTTGFGSADYEQWPQAAQMFLYVSCLIGGCAGSTSSGIKIIHFVVIAQYLTGTIRKLFFQPMSIVSIKLNGRQVDSSVADLALCVFIANFFMIFAGSCVLVLLDDMDYTTAMSCIISTLMDIGPGFGGIGPSGNYNFISDSGKWFLAWNMLVGRLEMFSVLVLFYPSFWKK
jgi:trk system potassium uptake protein TrkH